MRLRNGWVAATICLVLAGAAAAQNLTKLAEAQAFQLKPWETQTLTFDAGPETSGRQIALFYKAYGQNKTVSGHRQAVYVTVNRAFLRTRVGKSSRLLNKRLDFRFGRNGKRKSEWGSDTYRKTIGFEGAAVWLVIVGPDEKAIAQSKDYAPKGIKDPTAMSLDLTDLVRSGKPNVVRIQNVDPQMTLVFESAVVVAGPNVPARQQARIEALQPLRKRKSAATYYTPERIAIAKENIERYEWAKKLYQRIMKGDGFTYYIGPQYGGATKFAAQSDEFMWRLMPPTTIARKVPGTNRATCPVHGTKGRRHNPFCPWRINPITHPYKIQCMEGGEWYPSNDYLNGDMSSGAFADSGAGATVDGKVYHFMSEYTHMVYGSAVIPTLRSLSQAYLLTGNKQYAHKAVILMARLAEQYPNHDDRRDRLFEQRNLNRYKTGLRTGMVTDYIWATFCLEGFTYAYDALFDYILNDSDAAVAFLKAKGMPVESGEDLRVYIEDTLIRAGMTGLLVQGIVGNEGHHQAASMACALVMDDFADCRVNTQNMVDYYYHGVGKAAHILTNGITPDGGGHESINYSRIKLDFVRAARTMEALRARYPDKFPLERYPDIFGGDRGRAIFDYFIDVFLLDYFVPSIGDCGGIRRPTRTEPQTYSYRSKDYLYAFQRYGDLRFARACTKPDGALVEGDLFEPYPADAIREALKKPASEIIRKPRVLDDYGVAILESGAGEHRRATFLNYASTAGHRQFDNLCVGLFARGVDFLPDLGYPYSWRYRWQWDSNMMSHNTVCVDESVPARRVWSLGGPARLFASANGVHVVSAGHNPYPNDYDIYPPNGARFPKDAPKCSIYERTLVLVDVAPERFYLVDCFAVNGGSQHDQSWHGPLVPVAQPKLDWTLQPTGTLAGPDVAQFAKWKDRWGRERDDFPCFLKDIRRATLTEPALWTWDTKLKGGDALRLHLVPVNGPMEVIAGTGRSPDRAADWGLDYVIARRRVAKGERSLFLSVLDPSQSEPVVKSVRLASTAPLTLLVRRADGVDRITFQIPDGPSVNTAHRALGVQVQLASAAGEAKDVTIGATKGSADSGYVLSRVEAVDYVGKRIALKAEPGLEADLQPGRAVRIYNAQRSAMYRIQKTARERDRVWVTLDRSALLAQAPVTKIDQGRLHLGAELTFANGWYDKAGQRGPLQDAYAGARLIAGDAALVIAGVASQYVVPADDVSPAALRKGFLDQNAAIYQYGPGDAVEAARVKE